jgi:hypothetical protein
MVMMAVRAGGAKFVTLHQPAGRKGEGRSSEAAVPAGRTDIVCSTSRRDGKEKDEKKCE